MFHSSNSRTVLASLSLLALTTACGGGGGGGGGFMQIPPGIAPSATLSTVTANPTSVPADGTTASVIQVRVVDASGSPLAGRAVELRASNGLVTISGVATTDADGRTMGSVMSTQATTVEITAVVDPGAGEVALSTTVQLDFFDLAVPVPLGIARYEDVDESGTANAGDRIVVPFSLAVQVLGANAGDFSLPVLLDSLGTGATVVAGPQANEVTIVLGTSPRLRARGEFSSGDVTENAPTGIQLAGTTPSITSSGVSAEPAAQPLDLAAGIADRRNVDGANTARVAAAARFDRDGLMDLAVADDSASGTIRVLRNQGDGTYLFVTSVMANTQVRAIAAADIDGDGQVDLLVGGDNGLTSFLNTSFGAGTSFGSATAEGSTNVKALAYGDIDCDGDVDVVSGSTVNASLFLNNNGALSTPTVLTNANTDAIGLLDQNDDGALDVILGGVGAATSLLTGDGNGTFSAPVAQQTSDVRALAVADLDRDGTDDWLSARPRVACSQPCRATDTVNRRSPTPRSQHSSSTRRTSTVTAESTSRPCPTPRT